MDTLETNKIYKTQKKRQKQLAKDKSRLEKSQLSLAKENAKRTQIKKNGKLSTTSNKRIKKTPPTKLKKILLELCLIFGKIKEVDVNWFGYCITCKKRWPWWSMCWGHFVPQAKGLACKFELDNINLQCMGCNWMANQWEQYKHGVYIDRRYWEGRAHELLQQANTLKSWSRTELEDTIEYVENLIIELCKNHDKDWTGRLVTYIVKDWSRKAKCKGLLTKIWLIWSTI